MSLLTHIALIRYRFTVVEYYHTYVNQIVLLLKRSNIVSFFLIFRSTHIHITKYIDTVPPFSLFFLFSILETDLDGE